MGMTPQHFHTIPTSCAILPLLTQICFVCLLAVCRGLWKSVVGSAGTACWCAWGVGYVVGVCNVQCVCYTECGRYGLSWLSAETVESMSGVGSVWYVWYVWYVWLYGLYDMLEFKLCCEILLLPSKVKTCTGFAFEFAHARAEHTVTPNWWRHD